MPRGKLIVLEGNDASGKATQTRLLVDKIRFEGFPCETMSFPQYNTPTGRIVGECYLGKKLTPGSTGESWFGDANSVDPLVASLYYAADRMFAKPRIVSTIESGIHFVLDRWVEANLAHQGGKIADKNERLKMVHQIEALEYGALKLPRPDKVIFLYMPYRVAKILNERRGGASDGHEKNPRHSINTERAYLQLAAEFQWTKVDCAPAGDSESLRTPEDIAEEVYAKVKPILIG